MSCQEARSLLHAFLDDELDVVRSLEVQRHVETCAACAREHAAHRTLRGALRDESLYFRPSEDFGARIHAALLENAATGRVAGHAAQPGRAAGRAPGRVGSTASAAGTGVLGWLRWGWLPAAVTAALLVVTTMTIWRFGPGSMGPSAEDLLGQEVVTSHVRSLMAGHLTDVPSTDQHTVKPWFNGRLDFSPPVKDLAEQGFALIGGRLDYLSGRPVAALAYQRRQHIINLMIWPAPGAADRSPSVSTRQGYHLLHWAAGGMSFWAVSDLNEQELSQFATLLRG